MSDKKISQLPLTAAVNTDDTFEKSKHNAAPSERMTVAQLVTFLQTALASLTLADQNTTMQPGGAMNLGGNGSAGLLSIVDAVGVGVHQLNGGGSAFFGGNTISFPGDGSASFANGKATFTFGGAMTLGAVGADGISTTYNAAGDAVFVLNAALGLFQGGALPSFSLNAGDGSATLANGSATIDAVGNLGIGGTQVVTSQQPAIADATGAGDVVAQLNLLLAALRVHGLIAV